MPQPAVGGTNQTNAEVEDAVEEVGAGFELVPAYPYPPKESRRHLAMFAEENVGDSRLESGIMFLRTGELPQCEKSNGNHEVHIRISHKEAVRSGLGCELVRESSGNVCEAFNLWSNVRLDEQVLQIRTWFDLATDIVFAADVGLNLLVFAKPGGKSKPVSRKPRISKKNNTLVPDCFVCGHRFAVQLWNRPLAIIVQRTPQHLC